MIIPKFPSKEEIAEVIKKTEAILAQKKISKRKNLFYKESLEFCLKLLNERYLNPENPYFIPDKEEELVMAGIIYKNQLKYFDLINTSRGRAVAILCVDWLNGDKDAISFLNVEL
jgi:hypothetical protein